MFNDDDPRDALSAESRLTVEWLPRRNPDYYEPCPRCGEEFYAGDPFCPDCGYGGR